MFYSPGVNWLLIPAWTGSSSLSSLSGFCFTKALDRCTTELPLEEERGGRAIAAPITAQSSQLLLAAARPGIGQILSCF